MANVPPLVRFTAIGVLVVAFLLAFYGLMGLMRYDANALLEKMSDTSLEPVSEATVFLAHGLLPLILTVYGGIMALLASFLLRMRNNAVKWLEFGAWGGLAIGVACEVGDYISYIRRSSETPSIAYLIVGFMNSVLILAVWVSLPLALVWWLRSDRFLDQLEGE